MEFRQLKYFLAVAEEGLIVKAAERLNITQPPLSQQLLSLEEELGTQLFIRSKKHIQLTKSGQILKRRAEQMMELMNAAVNEIQEADTGVCGRLSIGVITSFGGGLLPGQIASFHERYPNVTFDLHQGDTQKIMELLQIGIIELGLVRAPFNMEVFDFKLLPQEELVLAAKAELFPKGAAPISFSQLDKQPLLLHNRHVAMVTQQCHMQGFEPYIFCTSDDIFPLLRWAAAKLGIAVVPAAAMQFPEIESWHLQFRHTDPATLTTTGALIFVKHKSLSTAAQHFIAEFHSHESNEPVMAVKPAP
jgi:DNA-binding transcriptional LysR family regulator